MSSDVASPSGAPLRPVRKEQGDAHLTMEEDDRYQATPACVPDAFFACDSTWKVTALSEEAAELLGTSEAELLGNVLWEQHPELNGTLLHHGCLRALSEGIVVGAEFQFPRFNCWYGIRIHPRSCGGVSVYFRDITGRRRSQEEARNNETLLRLMLENIRDYAIFSIDCERRVSNWNTGAERLFGYSEAEIVGQSGDVLYTPEDQASGVPQEEADKAVQLGRAEDKRWHQRKDGSRLFVAGMVRPMYDDDGSLRGFTKVAQDITENRRAEQALEYQANLLELTHDAIFVWELDGVISYWNRGAEQLYGFPREEALGRNPNELLQSEFPEGLEVALETLKQTGQWGGELRNTCRSGRKLVVESRQVLVKQPDGTSVVLDSSRDVTIRTQVEIALREENRRKSEFLAMLAHELRNPLAAIRNAVHVTDSQETDLEAFTWSKGVVDRQTQQLSRLVDDLLDVSRITSGKIRLQRRVLDAALILDHSLEVVQPLLAERKHEVFTSYEHGGVLRLNVDPVRLEQIVVNLLTNAAKYTPSGGKVWLIAHREGDVISIRVRDSGIGIHPEKLSEMFELFSQGDRGIARSEGGLGLGLTISRTLTEMHGGTIRARSAGPGTGSEFMVCLPAAAGEVPVASQTIENGAVNPEEKAQVLVVDDNQDTAEGMARLLKRRGYSVEVAHDGNFAVHVARLINPKIVLLDIGLPGMNGYEVASQLRREPCCEKALLIAVSGYGQEEDRRRSKAAGFDHHFVKPVDFQELVTLLQRRALSG